MSIPRFVAILSVGLMILNIGVVSGQNYPNKPIRIITSGAGGGIDFTARLIAQGLTGSLGQPVIVENRGAGSPAEIVSKALPDGYTLLVAGTGFVLSPLMRDKAPYDAVRDFSPITWAVGAPNVLVLHPSVPVKSVKELIALAKAKPGELNYASSSAGSGAHLAGELFKAMAGVNILHVPYKTAGAASTALLGGEVQMSFAGVGAVAPHVKSGKFRALGVGSEKPSALLPDLPTVASAGLPGFESVGRTTVLAPAKTPAANINRLYQEILRVLNRPESKKLFFDIGAEVVASSPEELAAKIKSEIVRMSKVIKDAEIREE